MRPKHGTVYILASRRLGTLYTGATSDLQTRLQQHRDGTTSGFASQYGVTRLVYVEHHARVVDAIRREKQIKKWNRARKVRLIEELHPDWCDLTDEVL